MHDPSVPACGTSKLWRTFRRAGQSTLFNEVEMEFQDALKGNFNRCSHSGESLFLSIVSRLTSQSSGV